MSLNSVRAFFQQKAPDIEVLVTAQSSATVALAAQAHGVEAGQIAKTICLSAGGRVVLVVTSGTTRLDNKKAKAVLGARAKMLDAEEVLARTGHPVGGVCPFGLAEPLEIYCDLSLRDFAEILPAAGAPNAAVRLTPDRLAALVDAQWADLASPAG